jgi:hypothetical protein
MTRLRAFLVHLSLSAAVVGCGFAIVFFVWYPQPYFEVVGAWYLIRILFIVDVVLGPLLTFIVFKAGKPGLRFDLTVIALVQIAALAYGATIIYQERPYYMVFAVDRFELLPRKDLDLSQIAYDALREKPWIGAVHVFAKLPDDPEALAKFTEEVVFEGKPDLERRPEFWHPYAELASEAPKQARDVHELLREDDTTAEKASRVIEKYESDHARLGYLPLLGRTSNFAIVLDMDTGEQLQVLDIDPYQLIIDRKGSSEVESE